MRSNEDPAREEDELSSQLKMLGLPPSSTFAALSQTLLQELLPGEPLATPPPPAALRALGYTGAPDQEAIQNFLLTSVRAHRIMQRAKAEQQSSVPPPADIALASAISRLHTTLVVPPADFEATPQGVAKTVHVLTEAVTEQLQGRAPRGEYLLTDGNVDAVGENQGQCETVLNALNREHALRVEMLLHRLQVTVQAFSRGRGADAAAFEKTRERVEALGDAAGDVSMFEALTARDWVLETGGVDTRDAAGVKSVVMGGVPDRGGRIGKASVGEMPRFRTRVAPVSREGSARGGRRGKDGKRRR